MPTRSHTRLHARSLPADHAANGVDRVSALTGFVLAVLAFLAATAAHAAIDVTAAGFAPEVRPLRAAASPSSLTAAADPERVALEVDAGELQALWGRSSARVRALPLPGGSVVDLELVAFDAAAADAEFVRVGADGSLPYRPEPMRFFHGKVAGVPDSLAYLWIAQGRIGGFVELRSSDPAAKRLVLIGPRAARLDDPLGREIVAMTPTAAGAEPGPYCGGAMVEALANPERLAPRRDPSITSTTPLKARIAIDATVEYYNFFGDVTAATNYVAALMGAVSTIYENEVQCRLDLGYLRVFTAEPDPYNGSTTSQLLTNLRTEWTTNPALQNVPRTVTHLFTHQPGLGGVAYLDVLCNTSYGYGVSSLDCNYTYPNGSYTWDADVVSHELGHNFGSPHTHCYVPEIDRCYNQEPGCYSGPVEATIGTIMSYCHLVAGKNLVFGQRVIDVIRPTIESAICIEPAGSPGEVRGDGNGLMAVKGKAALDLVRDDGASNTAYGYAGTSQAAWIKRFTPTCYPFELQGVDVVIDNGSVAAGRPIRVLVYADPTGSGDPAASTLVSTEDVTVQAVGPSFNTYTLASPVTVQGGDLYLGFYDLVADAADTYIMASDSSVSGDSWRKANSTTPSGYGAFGAGTYLVRGRGACTAIDAVRLSWADACNAAAVPGQDFGVYQGTFGTGFSDHASLACTTGKALGYTAAWPAGSTYFLVVPSDAATEGGYGPGVLPSALPCKPAGSEPCN